jgi:hypothetical protein
MMGDDKIAFGELEGETCWREGCQGVIAEHPVENCSCHIAPPCGSCTSHREYCPACDWIAQDDVEQFNDFLVKVNPDDKAGAWEWWKHRQLDPRKLDWRSKGHTNSSMIKEGVYPEGMTRTEVEAEVKGTFGGRFKSFGNGRFEYVAYTD